MRNQTRTRTRAMLATLITVLVLGTAVVAYAENAGSDSSTTGVAPDMATLNGQVVIGPVCPGPTLANQPPQCQDRPYAATLSIQTADSSPAVEVTQVTTDPQGQFSLQLAPATYHIVPLTPQGSILPRGVPQDVTLAPGDVVTITVQYDSGMR